MSEHSYPSLHAGAAAASANRRNGLQALAQEGRARSCFRDDQRYRCTDRNCELRAQCVRLIAEWRR